MTILEYIKQELRSWLLFLGSVCALAGFASLLVHMGMVGLLRTGGIIGLFFLPGWFASYCILPERSTSPILRFGISVTASLATQPLLLFLLSRIGLPINLWTSFLAAFILIAAFGVIAHRIIGQHLRTTTGVSR